MIKPDKNIKLSYSLIGVGALVLTQIATPITISSLWQKIRHYEEIANFEKFVLTLDFLFMCNLVKFENGLLVRIKND